MSKNIDGAFRRKKGFTIVQNTVARNNTISMGAKGLYTLIQSYITMHNREFYKEDFLKMVPEGKKIFNKAWDELKMNGYLVKHIYRVKDGFRTEYDLKDEPAIYHTVYYGLNGDITRIEYIDGTVSKGKRAKDELWNTPTGASTERLTTKEECNNSSINKIYNIYNTIPNKKKISNFECIDIVGCPDDIRSLIEKWVKYRTESNDIFSISSMTALIDMVKKAVIEKGYNYVSDVIDHAIASNYKGIPRANLHMSASDSNSKPRTTFHQFDMKHNYDYNEMEAVLLNEGKK